jgi:SAM-dependent methyltransferase
LQGLLEAHAGGCDRIAVMLRSGIDSSAAAPTVDAGLAFVERLFDWSVQQSEEASVALYSLGSPAVLADATAEVVSLLSSWGLLCPDRTVLQIGCGIGRFEVAIAPLVRVAIGLDVSQKMIDAAARRCDGLGNVRLLKTDGRDLASIATGSVDLVYAVDTFPYLVQAGREVVATHVAESRRVLRHGGELVILNFSYRDDPGADTEDVMRLSAANGFTVLVAGQRPFRLWNGAAYRLRREPD